MHTIADVPSIYDISIDGRRPVTQADVDALVDIVNKAMQMPQRPEPLRFNFDKKLAIYPNRMRPGYCFVAEDKPIAAYDGVRGLHGEPLYPSVPNHTDLILRSDLRTDFAAELVRRWNQAAAYEVASDIVFNARTGR